MAETGANRPELLLPRADRARRWRRRRDPYMVFSRLSGALLAAFGLFVLAGWCAGIPEIPRTFTSSVPVKANTAISFLLLGLLLLPGRVPRRWRRAVETGSGVAAGALAAIGLATAAQYIFGIDLHIDRILGPDRMDMGMYPGRMALNSALAFPLLGASALLARRPSLRIAWAGQLAAAGTFLTAYMGILGYAFGVTDLYKLNSYTVMAPQTAIATLLASLACLARWRRTGPAACFASRYSGGALLRWMLGPLALLLPAFAWLCLLGLNLELLEPGAGLALYATAGALILGSALWWFARALNRADGERLAAERGLRKLNHSLERRVEERTRALNTALAEREESLLRETSLRRELDHRVRNNLAGLMGLVGLYERSGRTSRQFAAAVRGKVLAMKEVHEIIAHAGGRSVALGDLLERLMRSAAPAEARRRVAAEIEPVRLSPGEAGAFAMIIQELTTNSIKYGALASREGRVRLRARVQTGGSGPFLAFDWREEGCPDEPTPGGTGIGLGLVRDFARTDLRGKAEFTSGAGVWRCRIAASLRELRSARPPAAEGCAA